MHCTCDGSCGRGHAPKLCGKRRYEKRANCNQCKVSYYAIAKRKSTELENVRPPPVVGAPGMHPGIPPSSFHPHLSQQPPPKWGSFTNSLHDGLPKNNPLPSQPKFTTAPRPPIELPQRSSVPQMPTREQLEKWRSFLMEEPATIVVWDDVKDAINSKLDGETSPMSNSSSEADLSSLAPEASTAQPAVPEGKMADANVSATSKHTGEVSKLLECGDLKDPDDLLDDGSFSSIEDGLFDSMLDDMVDDGGWGNFGAKDAPLKTDDSLFAEVF